MNASIIIWVSSDFLSVNPIVILSRPELFYVSVDLQTRKDDNGTLRDSPILEVLHGHAVLANDTCESPFTCEATAS